MNRLLLSLILLGASVLTVGAQNEGVDTIPIVFQNGQVVVPANIGGKKVNLLFDTGSTMSSVLEGILDSALQIGKIKVDDAHDLSHSLDVVDVCGKVGRFQLFSQVSIFPSKPIFRCLFDGVLGSDFLNHQFAVKIDTRRGILVLTHSKHFFDREPGERIPYKTVFSCPCVKLQISPDNVLRGVLFDTGSACTFQIGENALQRFRGKLENQILWEGEGKSSVSLFNKSENEGLAQLLLDSVCVGKFAMKNVCADTRPSYSTLGSWILGQGTFIFDGFRKRLVFNPYDGGHSVECKPVAQNYRFAYDDEGFLMIGMVDESSPEYEQGMRCNDRVLALDGFVVDSPCSFKQIEQSSQKKFRTLKLRDKEGHEKIVCLAPAEE